MEALKKYKFFDQIKVLTFVKNIYIFGSRARGDNEERSDIDIAISCNRNINTDDWMHLLTIIENRDTLLEVDLVALDILEDGEFKNTILREKIEWK